MVRGRYSNMSYFITAMKLLCNTHSSVIREHYPIAPCTLKHIKCLILHKKLLSTEAVCRARWINWKWTPSYCFRGHVNMCNIVDENTSTALSTLNRIHSRQFHVIILYNLHKNECPRKQYVGARWINWKWTFLYVKMSISNLFSGPFILLPWTRKYVQYCWWKHFYCTQHAQWDPFTSVSCHNTV